MDKVFLLFGVYHNQYMIRNVLYYQSAFILYIIYTRHAPLRGLSICRTYCQSLFVGPLLFALETSLTSEAQVLVVVFVLSSMDRES